MIMPKKKTKAAVADFEKLAKFGRKFAKEKGIRKRDVIRVDHENTESWNNPLGYYLPASSKKFHMYLSGKYLYNIMTGRDGEIALNHMTNMLSLLEKLVKELHRCMHPDEEPLYTGRRNVLINFLLQKGFLLPEEENEFRLAGETRNCVIHNGHEIDEKWLKAYSNARNASFLTSITTDLYRAVPPPRMEEWHALFLRITERMEKEYMAN